MKRVVIIGAGVLGAAAAYALAGKADVTLVDAGEVGGGTSSRSFARLSAWGKQPDAYVKLNLEGIRAHHATPGPWLHACGTLLHGTVADRLQAERLGYVVECSTPRCSCRRRAGSTRRCTRGRWPPSPPRTC